MAKNEHVEALKAARVRLVEDRRKLAQELGQPYERGEADKWRERGETEKWRELFLDVQRAIAAIDDAIKDEQKLNPEHQAMVI